MNTSKNLFRIIVMFIVGFMAYITIEVLYRGFSFPLMGILGGVIFLLIDGINERYSWDTELWFQAIAGGMYVTIIELIFGLIDREVLHMNMWDYSDQAFNFMGVICPKFSLCWCLLSVFAVLVADFVNYCLDRTAPAPYYVIFGKKYTPGIYEVMSKKEG